MEKEGAGSTMFPNNSSAKEGVEPQVEILRVPLRERPLNITGLFKGKWSISTGIEIKDSVYDAGYGSTMMNLHFYSTKHPDVQCVKGTVRIRNGPYITDHGHRYYVLGLYLWKIGQMFAVAKNGESVSVGNSSLHMSAEMLTGVWEQSQGKNHTRNFISPSLKSLVLDFAATDLLALYPGNERNSSVSEKDVDSDSISDAQGNEEDEEGSNTAQCEFRIYFQTQLYSDVSKIKDRILPELPNNFTLSNLSKDAASIGTGPDKLPILRGSFPNLGGSPAILNSDGTPTDSLGSFISGKINAETRVQQYDPSVSSLEISDFETPPTLFKGSFFSFSNSCEPRFEINLVAVTEDLAQYYDQALNFITIAFLLTLLELYIAKRLFDKLLPTSALDKVSLTMAAHLTISSGIFSVMCLTLSSVVDDIFAPLAYLKFIQFSLVDMRHLLYVWRAHRTDLAQEGLVRLRREFSTVQARFYMLFTCVLVLVYIIREHEIFIVVLWSSFWLHQIVFNIFTGRRRPFTKEYIFGMSITHSFYPLYFWANPTSELTPPNFLAAFSIVSWIFFQLAVLIGQDLFGPKFFLPYWLLPKSYNYFRRVTFSSSSLYDVERACLDCTVCMMEISEDLGTYMVTPCQHIFHTSCLREWMKVKMQCPICRGLLPVDETMVDSEIDDLNEEL